MSTKFDLFEAALEKLCKDHAVRLYESYDGVVVEDCSEGGVGVYLIDSTEGI